MTLITCWAILAQAELAESDLPEASAPKEQVRQIKAVAIRASEVVRELSIFSGQEEAKLAPVDLSGLVEEMSHLLKVSISKHAKLHLDLSKDIPPVWGNAVQIRQLAMNLILNASQAIGEKPGVIHVETSLAAGSGDLATANDTSCPDAAVRLVVTDTGCGMTEQEKARVFDPFFTTKPKGHGLGLAVVQGIVQSHNGAINVKSTLGNGTTFEVLFRPSAVEFTASSREALSSTANEPAPFPAAIFLVEDEDLLRAAIETALYKAGFLVLSVADGLKAVEVFDARADDIGVVVLDCVLPGLSGQAVFRHIRSVKPEMRVVFTTSSDPKIDDPALSGEPNITFLQKPYTFRDLLRELSQAHAHTFPRQVPRQEAGSI
jgi:two-component system cell cycle sensor histidine kinase/response regulator CckA